MWPHGQAVLMELVGFVGAVAGGVSDCIWQKEDQGRGRPGIVPVCPYHIPLRASLSRA